MSCASSTGSRIAAIASWAVWIEKGLQIYKTGLDVYEGFQHWDKLKTGQKAQCCLSFLSILFEAANAGAPSVGRKFKISEKERQIVEMGFSTLSSASQQINLIWKRVEKDGWNLDTAVGISAELLTLSTQLANEALQRNILSEKDFNTVYLVAFSGRASILTFNKKHRDETYAKIAHGFDVLSKFFAKLRDYIRPSKEVQAIAALTRKFVHDAGRRIPNAKAASDNIADNLSEIEELRQLQREIEAAINTRLEDALLPNKNKLLNDQLGRFTSFICQITNELPRFPARPKIPESYKGQFFYYCQSALRAKLEEAEKAPVMIPGWPRDIPFRFENIVWHDSSSSNMILIFLKQYLHEKILRINGLQALNAANGYIASAASSASSSSAAAATAPAASFQGSLSSASSSSASAPAAFSASSPLSVSLSSPASSSSAAPAVAPAFSPVLLTLPCAPVPASAAMSSSSSPYISLSSPASSSSHAPSASVPAASFAFEGFAASLPIGTPGISNSNRNVSNSSSTHG